MTLSTTYASKCGSSFPFHSFVCHYNPSAYHQLQPPFTSWSWNKCRRTGDLVRSLRFPSAETPLPVWLFQGCEASCGEEMSWGQAQRPLPLSQTEVPRHQLQDHVIPCEHGLPWVQCFEMWNLWSTVPEKTFEAVCWETVHHVYHKE